MKINNVNISNFGSKLIGYEVQDTDLNYSSQWAPRALTPINSLETPKYKNVKIEILVQGPDRLQVEKNKSLLQNNLRKGVVTFPDSTMLYEGLLDGIKFVKKTNLDYIATVDFVCIMSEPETTINLNKTSTQSVNIKGNSEVEVIYTVTTTTTIGQLKINDITINNVLANQTLIIDGVNKKITQNGINKFKDCDMVKFPTLQPGNNTITINVLTPTITLKYKPRWS